MATATSKARKSAKTQDATVLLKTDHQLVSDLFDEYEAAYSNAKKKQIANQICKELTVHAQIEEEIFYPAVKQAMKDKELIPEARIEHATLKSLASQLEGMEPDDEMFDAKVKVMHEYVKHHVKEEQNEIFPKAKSTGLDMMKLGARLSERKAELRAARS
ncbi:hemerythrin domain-containing protein [Candidatus Methylobacter oryzae]|uniref:Hemerythrin domain-containing protein n=1 Tax=Candidatus Methylobacter oryzae TaxID=2497749 RepID=A0ABY3C6S7_9GAMM|nr:hemerythrin domain-containing protein [Candidatus Methylobacter oryzae]TRW91257.1 hemerythrin domain-containing protein [Candidatus Methylobacter oryzae]